MKTVLILGAGRGQMPIYEICKSLGCRIVFVTPEGEYPGIGKAEVRFANVQDYKSVYEIAKEEVADAIITDQLDAGVYSCAYASEKLGLIGIGAEVAKMFTNKYEMRRKAQEAGIDVPAFFAAKTEKDIENVSLSFPVIIKPSDNASSRGIFLVDNKDELLSHFDEAKSYSSEGVVLIERLIKGTEYVVESYTKEYRTTNLIVGHSDYFNIPKRFVPKGRVFRDASVANSYVEQKVIEANNKVIKAFGLPFGTTHGEYIYNEEEDKVYLIEIAARGGGEFICGTLIPLASGIRANEMMVKHSLGIAYDVPIEHLGKAAAYFSYLLPEGEIIGIDGVDKVKAINGVFDPMFDNISLGMKTPPIIDKSSRKGPLLVRGETEEDCYKVRSQIKEALNIRVRTNSGEIKGIIWD